MSCYEYTNLTAGNKKDNLTIIYTPADNLKKTGDMEVGQVSFHNDKKVWWFFHLYSIYESYFLSGETRYARYTATFQSTE